MKLLINDIKPATNNAGQNDVKLKAGDKKKATIYNIKAFKTKLQKPKVTKVIGIDKKDNTGRIEILSTDKIMLAPKATPKLDT